MAKNYAAYYNGGNASTAVDVRFYLKEELSRGVFQAPGNVDYFYTLQGGAIKHTQPVESSPYRSGRHHTGIIKQKKKNEWNFPAFFDIDTGVGAGATEIPPAMRTLWKALLGRETVSSGLIYDAAVNPATSFTLMECGDQWALQSAGSFVQQCEITLPGDGQSQMAWSGESKTGLLVGIAKSTADNNGGNTIELEPGEAWRIPVGAKIMIIEANGTTRSADTPVGSPRTVTISDKGTDILTIDGAVLADADGSGGSAPIYVCYYEPDAPVAINNPQTGLEGEVEIDTLPTLSCVRNAKITIANNHEVVNYCFGCDSLCGPLFIPGSRLMVTAELELNLDAQLVEFYNKVEQFEAHAVNLYLGSQTTRHLKIELAKLIFNVPEINVPQEGSIPVTFTSTAYQTALDAADEIKVKFL